VVGVFQHVKGEQKGAPSELDSHAEVLAMAELTWRHGTTAGEAKQALERAIGEAGYTDYVKWNGLQATASAGLWSSLLSLKGRLTEDEVVVNSCRGVLAGRVLKSCREMLDKLFPGGAVV
jgi:hypothetical protein